MLMYIKILGVHCATRTDSQYDKFPPDLILWYINDELIMVIH